jgi:hypothetical protein
VTHEQQIRYCLRARGRSLTLFTSTGAAGGYDDIVTASRVVLAGTVVAYAVDDIQGGGRYGNTFGTVIMRDLRTGRSAQGGGSGCCDPPTLVVSPAGIVLWQIEENYTTAATGWTWQVETLNDRTGDTVVLDTAPAITAPAGGFTATPPFANLQLQRCIAGCIPQDATFASWRYHGVWRSSRVG